MISDYLCDRGVGGSDFYFANLIDLNDPLIRVVDDPLECNDRG